MQQRSFVGNDARTLDGRGRQGQAADGVTTLPIGRPSASSAPTPNPFADLEPTVRRDGSSGGRAAFPVSHTATTNQDLPPAGDSPESVLGNKVGDYILERVIGQGGMAAVYQAIHPLIGKQVAIKVMLPVRDDSDFARRMVQEAQTVNAIEHPNIVEIYGAGTLSDGRPYIIMQYLDGQSLSHWVRDLEADLPVDTILRLLEQLFSALDAAHLAGVVHRDIKPANVMLTNLSAEVPTVKVVDFGLAKGVNASVKTAPDLVLGTPGYVSPEQIRGDAATPRSDLYSAGLVAWYLVSREEPYPREARVLETMRKQLSQPPPPIPRAGLPPELVALISELCSIDPLQRPPTGAVVAGRLRSIAMKVPATELDWHNVRTVVEPQGTKPDRPAVPRRGTSEELERLRADEPPPGQRRSGPVPKQNVRSNTRLQPAAVAVSEPDLSKVRSKTPYVVAIALAVVTALVVAWRWWS